MRTPRPDSPSPRRRWLALLALAALLPAARAHPVADPEAAARPPLWSSLEPAEQAFLRAHPRVRIGVERAWQPVDFLDEEGRHSGLAADVLAELSRLTGLQFDLVMRPSWEEVERVMREGGIDLLPALVDSPAREEYLRFTRPYLDIFMVVVTRDDSLYVAGLDDLDGRRVAMARGFASTSVFLRDYPQMQPVPVLNAEEALTAVAVGRADATVVPLAVANSHIERRGLTNLRIAAPASELRQELKMGVRRDWPELVGIIDKGLRAMEERRLGEIRARWLGVLPMRERDVVSPRELLALGVVLIVLLLTLLWALSLRREIGRRRRAQDRAEQAERRLRDLAEGIPGAIWQLRREVDGHQHYTFMSEGIRRITGRTPEETNALMQSKSFVSVHPDDLGRLQALMERLTVAGGIDEERYRLSTKDGGWKWVQAAAYARREPDGAMVWNGITLDASRMQQIEEELGAARHRLQELIDSVPGAVWRLRRDHQGRYVFDYVSEGVLKITGRSASEVMGDSGSAFGAISAGDRERLFAELGRSALDGNPMQLEFRSTDVQGELRHLSVRANVSLNADGEPVWTGVLIDITTRRALEVALAEAHSRLDDIVANFPGAIWQMKRDIAGREFFTYMSDSIVRITGRPAEATINKPSLPFEVMLPEDRERARQLLYAALDRAEPVTIDYRLVTASGQPRWVHVTATARREADGEVVWNGVVLDATEQKRLEADLRDARRAAEAASQAKSRFLANMSHEIRTPMNAVIGLAHLAHDAERDDEQRERLAKISRAAKALLRLLNDILEFSKLEAGKLRLAPVPFALTELLDTLRLLASASAVEKGLDFVIELDPALPPRFLGDTLRIQQVLLNLLANATKFTDAGAVALKVRLAGEPDADPVVVAFEIHDTGIGMSEAELARVFDAFEQADDATSRRHGGSGLGLTISQELVRLMGGEISVRSAPGSGTQFTVLLPLVRVSPPEPPPCAAEGLEQDLAGCVDRLMGLLKGRDTAARSQALALRALRARQGQAEELDAMERLLSAYDFESAELELARLAARWGLPPPG